MQELLKSNDYSELFFSTRLLRDHASWVTKPIRSLTMWFSLVEVIGLWWLEKGRLWDSWFYITVVQLCSLKLSVLLRPQKVPIRPVWWYFLWQVSDSLVCCWARILPKASLCRGERNRRIETFGLTNHGPALSNMVALSCMRPLSIWTMASSNWDMLKV